ncbi:MAG: type II toxin-antitoxin system prevent-host-death family antitoxin [Gemmatimonadota bacterium]
MMIYSIYEAKAKFSELIRRVRQGSTVIVSHRGKPVAEIRPIKSADIGLGERIEQLERRGVLRRPNDPEAPLEAVARRPGALQRFLDERDENEA